jgi:hypothetical protein
MPPQNAVYFTDRNNPETRAHALVDAGMLEAVPICLPQGKHPVGPRDDGRPIVKSYRSVLRRGNIRPGRHIIMEMEHLADIGHRVPNSEAEWKSMERHFSRVRSKCPKLEPVGASEAIYEWLHYYSPELIVRLAPPQQRHPEGDVRRREAIYPLVFLGDGILNDGLKPHEVRIHLPLLDPRTVRRMRITEAGKTRQDIRDYSRPSVLAKLFLSIANANSFHLVVEM